MKFWSDFYDLVMPDLPDCPFAAADSALRQSAITFCEQSLVWQATHPDISIAAGTAKYAFASAEGTVVHAIIHAALNGEEIEPYGGEMSITTSNWRRESGTPRYVLGGAASLTLVPQPVADGTLAMIVALKPSAASTGIIEDTLFNEYCGVIVHGALARLMLSPRKPYTNVQFATYHQQQFTIKTAAAGVRVARGHTRAPLRTAILKRG
jgi:hypothetical protein